MSEIILSVENAVNEINFLHREIEGYFKKSLEYGIRIGEILSEVKRNLPHGSFIPFIEKNCVFSRRTASSYIALYDNVQMLKSGGYTDINSAYKAIKVAKQRKMDDDEIPKWETVSHLPNEKPQETAVEGMKWETVSHLPNEKPFSKAELMEIELMIEVGVTREIGERIIWNKRRQRAERQASRKAEIKQKKEPKFKVVRLDPNRYKELEAKAKERKESIVDLFFELLSGL